MGQQKLFWLGLIVDERIIDKNLGEGAFSYIFKGASLAGGRSAVYKLAKAQEFVVRNGERPVGQTEALSFFTGGSRGVRPNAAELLNRQFEVLLDVEDDSLVKVDTISQTSGLDYYRMEFIIGANWRQEMTERKVGLASFISLVSCLDRLSKNPRWKYHGDLKPENIMQTDNGLKLIDPGYFGPLNCVEGAMQRCAITTELYYPSLTPDDLLASGLILWEICLGLHPLVERKADVVFETYKPSAALAQRIGRWGALGYFGFDSLLTLPRVTALEGSASAVLEKILLKALRLNLTADGELDVDDGFANFGALREALTAFTLTGGKISR